VHCEAPASEYFPSAQRLVHDELRLATPEKVPDAHGWHDEEPLTAL